MSTDAPAIGTLFDLAEYTVETPEHWQDPVDWQKPQRVTSISASATPGSVSYATTPENRSTGPTEASGAILGPSVAEGGNDAETFRGSSLDASDAEIPERPWPTDATEYAATPESNREPELTPDDAARILARWRLDTPEPATENDAGELKNAENVDAAIGDPETPEPDPEHAETPAETHGLTVSQARAVLRWRDMGVNILARWRTLYSGLDDMPDDADALLATARALVEVGR